MASQEVTELGGKLRDGKESATMKIWGKSPPGRGKNECKGLEIGTRERP